MEGRCGQPTMSGSPCRNRVKVEGPCRCHTVDNQCSVCFSNMAQGTRTLGCGHTFHSRCVDRWKYTCTGGTPTCPMCRTPFDVPQYRVILTIQRVAEGTESTQEVPVTQVTRLVNELGLDLRMINENTRMDVAFDVEQNEDLREVLESLGILHFTFP